MINIHHFEELNADPEGNKDKYMSLWLLEPVNQGVEA
jgi:hypothetical protein